MRFFPTLVLSVGLLATIGPVVASESGPHSVKSGVQTIVLSYASYNPDTCYFGVLPEMRVVTPPAHGTLAFGKSAHKVSAGRCEGRMLTSTAVAYRSHAGFRGRDEMVVEVSTEVYTNAPAGKRGDTVRITVDVK